MQWSCKVPFSKHSTQKDLPSRCTSEEPMASAKKQQLPNGNLTMFPPRSLALSLSLFFLFHLHKKLRGQDCQPASQQKDRRAKKTEQQSPGATNPWNRNKNASEQASCACPMYRQQIQAPMSQRPGNLRKFNDHTSLILARFLFAAANRLKAPVQPNSSDGAPTVRNTPWLQSVKFTPVLSTGVLRASQFKNYTKSAKQTRFPVGP